MNQPTIYYSDVFPTTPEEFDSAVVIHSKMTRIDLVRWINTMVKTYPYSDQSIAEKLKYYTTIITYSFDRINWLYKLQAASNLRQGILINVQPENYHYNILFKANQSWLTLTFEIVNIFIRTGILYSHRLIYKLPTSSPTGEGRQVMDLIVENQSLYEIIKQLEDDLNIVLDIIRAVEAEKGYGDL